MTLLEILLLLVGITIFIISYRLPAKKEEQLEETKRLAKEEISDQVKQELGHIREQVEGTVDETITYAMEKTERFMDKLTNEKMMAISQYSDSVMEDIRKDHAEVLFLYDMLNDKHENVKTAAAEVDQAVREVRQLEHRTGKTPALKRAEAEIPATATSVTANTENAATPITINPVTDNITIEKMSDGTAAAEKADDNEAVPQKGDPGIPLEDMEMENRNDEILAMHRQGKSNVAIARELGMGVGEVKLVIDLFEGSKR